MTGFGTVSMYVQGWYVHYGTRGTYLGLMHQSKPWFGGSEPIIDFFSVEPLGCFYYYWQLVCSYSTYMGGIGTKLL